MKAILTVSVMAALSCMSASADVMRLRDGRAYSGLFLGATRTQIWFQPDVQGEFTGTGTLAVPLGQVQGLTFGSSDASYSSKSRVLSKRSTSVVNAANVPRLDWHYLTTILATAWFPRSMRNRAGLETSPALLFAPASI